MQQNSLEDHPQAASAEPKILPPSQAANCVFSLKSASVREGGEIYQVDEVPYVVLKGAIYLLQA